MKKIKSINLFIIFFFIIGCGYYPIYKDLNDINFSITPGAIDFIVDKAYEFNLGARGLRTLCEAILNDAMFNLPGSEVKKLVVNKKYAEEQLSRVSFEKLKAAS